MKLSNKILIGFFALIFVYLTAAFTELRVRGISHHLDEDNSVAETVRISGVNQLVLPNLREQIYVIASDTARLEVRSNAGNMLQKLTYSFTGDKLTLKALENDNDVAVRISIYVPRQSLQRITTEGTSLTISGLQRNVLQISQKDGWIYMTDNNQIGKLDLHSSHSNFTLNESTLDTLAVSLHNADVSIESPVKFLDGQVSDTSTLRMHGIDQILTKKDVSSRLYLE